MNVRTMLDIPDDVLARLDAAVAARQALWHASPKVARRSKPKYRKPSGAELAEALRISEARGTDAGNAWLKAKTLLPVEPVMTGRRPATDDAACPSRTLLVLELMRRPEVSAIIDELARKGTT